MGNVCRFNMRGIMSQVAMVTQKSGWESSLRMEERVIEELEFWWRNLRKLNGWRMRSSEEVMYCKEGS